MKYKILKVNLFIEFNLIIDIGSLNKLSIVKSFELFFRILLIKFKFVNKEIRKLLSYILFNYLFFKTYYIDKIMKYENYYYKRLDISNLIYDQVYLIIKYCKIKN